MSISTSRSVATRQSITVKKPLSKAGYFDILYTVSDYYKAMKSGSKFPYNPLPSLNHMLDAYMVALAYVDEKPLPPLKLVSALAKIDQSKIVATWLLYQEPNLNIKVGTKQIVVVNTDKL